MEVPTHLLLQVLLQMRMLGDRNGWLGPNQSKTLPPRYTGVPFARLLVALHSVLSLLPPLCHDCFHHALLTLHFFLQLLLSSMDMERIRAMRRQKELQQSMEFAHKTGNHAEVARIKRLLEPDK
jgi:hypothetical protein